MVRACCADASSSPTDISGHRPQISARATSPWPLTQRICTELASGGSEPPAGGPPALRPGASGRRPGLLARGPRQPGKPRRFRGHPSRTGGSQTAPGRSLRNGKPSPGHTFVADVRSTRGALPVFRPVGFPESPPEPCTCRILHPCWPQADGRSERSSLCVGLSRGRGCWNTAGSAAKMVDCAVAISVSRRVERVLAHRVAADE
jgi:hypothetical protein